MKTLFILVAICLPLVAFNQFGESYSDSGKIESITHSCDVGIFNKNGVLKKRYTVLGGYNTDLTIVFDNQGREISRIKKEADGYNSGRYNTNSFTSEYDEDGSSRAIMAWTSGVGDTTFYMELQRSIDSAGTSITSRFDQNGQVIQISVSYF